MAQTQSSLARWNSGVAPVAVVMISLNEGHNLSAICENLMGWAQEVFLVDSFSKDETVSIALAHGIHVVQRKFVGFGDQWRFAVEKLPITAPWVLKLDPDERLSDELKAEIIHTLAFTNMDGFSLSIRLMFMDRLLPVRLQLVRLWRRGVARIPPVAVNEHFLIAGSVGVMHALIFHRDSPDLEHWLEKQNRYSTAEALMAYQGAPLAIHPRLFGKTLERRMWIKKNYRRLPMRHFLFFLYCYLFTGAYRCGWVGYVWARLRSDVMRLIEYKRREMELTGRLPGRRIYGAGDPDPRVPQYE